jgi:hypothetical protein
MLWLLPDRYVHDIHLKSVPSLTQRAALALERSMVLDSVLNHRDDSVRGHATTAHHR